jgi:NDP-sugar pyrophosphorylase family protein
VRAIVLAAGLGRRLRPLTRAVPKCLLEVGGEPILHRLLAAVAGGGALACTVVVGYRAEQVRRAVAGWDLPLPVELVDNPGYASAGSAKSWLVGLAAGPGPGEHLLAEGDVVFEPRILGLLGREESVTLAARPRAGQQGSFLRLDREGWVLEWVHRDDQRAAFSPQRLFKSVNVTRFDGRTAQRIAELAARPGEPAGAGAVEQLLSGLVRRGEVELRAALVPSGSWIEVDDAGDLEEARSWASRRQEGGTPAGRGCVG